MDSLAFLLFWDLWFLVKVVGLVVVGVRAVILVEKIQFFAFFCDGFLICLLGIRSSC